MRLLVTGAHGWIGSHLCPALREAGHDLYLLDRRADGLDLSVPHVLDAAIVRRLHDPATRPDMVLHIAAQPGRVFGEDDVAHTVRSNAQMTAMVARACGDAGVRLCYFSTSEVYGPSDHWVDESSPTRPINLYGLTKLWGEEAARLYAPKGLLILRPTMPYGPGMAYGRGRCALMTMLANALHGEPVVAHRGCERAWCYVSDLVSGLLLAIGWGQGIYNVGRDDDARSMFELAELACEIAGASTSLIRLEQPDGTVTPVKRIRCDRLRQIGFSPAVDLKRGMVLAADWIREHDPIRI